MDLSKLALLATLAAACAPTLHVTPLNPAPRPMSPRSPETVELFTSNRPAQPYVDVALLRAEQWERVPEDDEMAESVAALRERAAQMGCDAVIITGMTASEDDEYNVRHGMYATCAVYNAPLAAEVIAERQERASHDKCMARRAERLELAQRITNEKARANILASAPQCPGDVAAR